MGACVNFTNHIHIAVKSFENGALKGFGYNDISSEMMEKIVNDQKIK